MSFPRDKIGKQGKWGTALGLFIAPLLLVLVMRWILFEPFVIPSESMVPNLLVHDHIFVTKYSYGIKMPFGDGWLFKYKEPSRGDIIVFRYPENRDVFYIKRLIGLPGDRITVQNGQISVNGKPWIINPQPKEIYNDEDDFSYYLETIPDTENSETLESKLHLMRLSTHGHSDTEEKFFEVPINSYFVMGDNRDQSHDSRSWGYVNQNYLIGRASYIWLSCEDTIPTAPMLCDPLKLRLDRIFKKVGSIL